MKKKNHNIFPSIVGLVFIVLTLSGCATAVDGANANSANNARGTSGLESYNRTMYGINRAIDNVTLKPLAQGYRAITPDVVETKVDNFFNNLREVSTFANSILQGKFHNAAASSARLVWNSTVGIGGLFDVATAMNIHADQEDFGQTLRTWGVPTGPYIVLPILGPSTPTDTFGLVGDYFMSPLSHEELWRSDKLRTGLVVLNTINTRAQLLTKEKILENGVGDEYAFVKSAYLQRRDALAHDTKKQAKQDNSVDEAFDELFGDEGK